MNIGYARVSTEEQNLDLQIDALNNANCEQIYSERASGKERSRPELNNVLKALREGDTLIVWRIDRLSRNMKDIILLVEELLERNIGFCSLSENIDARGTTGRLILNIFAAFADHERRLISERTKAGLEARRKRGIKGGRKPLLSYMQIRQLKALYDSKSVPVSAIAQQFGISRATLYNTIKRVKS